MVDQGESETPSDEIEVNEAYWGLRKVWGKGGQGAGGKIPVFGVMKSSRALYCIRRSSLFATPGRLFSNYPGDGIIGQYHS